MSEFWSAAYSVCKVIGNWYWGGFDGLLSSLAVFIVIVHITNGMCAIIDRRPIGRVGIQDILKSALIFILVGIGNILDTNVLTNTSTLRTAVILFYLSVEGKILLENIVHLGLPVPEQLRKALEQMRQNRIDNT
ncbi:MAG: phage holin family protein [Clostridiales bacterium]|nr:phage holin family protein [Clostridiales bacterium]